ncbi:M48 family metalloprotease [Streptomyces stramineus]
MDGAALSQLVMPLPTALISLVVVSLAFSLVNPLLGLVMAAVWLLSGPLVFHRPAEAAIARHLLKMRRPTREEAERLDAVWEEVTRRAGVSQGTYELWVQERAELNATAAAGHIVAVTRHALDRLPNSQLAAVLAHELGHHVGGHTWAGMLADWYALPPGRCGGGSPPACSSSCGRRARRRWCLSRASKFVCAAFPTVRVASFPREGAGTGRGGAHLQRDMAEVRRAAGRP